MINAAAPITGGISCPPTEPVATTAPAEFVVIAGFFHKRDREGTGRNNDGYGCTVDHSEKTGSNDYYLCRAPFVPPAMAFAKSLKNCPMPHLFMTSPKAMKRKM